MPDSTPSPENTFAEAAANYTPLVSVEEHEQGWKDIEVTLRSGKKEILRLFAIPARKGLKFFQRLVRMNEGEQVMDEMLIEAVRGDDKALALLDAAGVNDVSTAQAVAMELTFGADLQKKMLLGMAAALAAAGASGSTSTPPKPDASAAASPATI